MLEATVRGTSDRLAYFRALEEKPYTYDFFQALRRIECLSTALPPIGRAVRPSQEPIRLGQEPALDFAPATISALHPGFDGRPPRLEVRFLGLLGPNGPMPLHITDYARERLRHGGDETLARFFDLFNHRFLALFYRAWAQAQPAVNLDRPAEDRFAIYAGSLIGLGSPRMRHRDEVPDRAKLHRTGVLARQVRNRDGLEALLRDYFRVPVAVQEFVGHWMTLPSREQSRLGGGDSSVSLGVGAVLGARVWDRQHRIRVRVGPLDLARYESFLPGQDALASVIAWLRTYLCFELEWDLCLVLVRAQVPQLRLGSYGRLGWTTWLGRYTRAAPADDLHLDAERLIAQRNPAAARDAPELQAAAA